MDAEMVKALGELTAGGALIVGFIWMLLLFARYSAQQNKMADKLIDLLDEKTEPKRPTRKRKPAGTSESVAQKENDVANAA